MQQSGRADVRTKVGNLQSEFDELFFDLLEQLRAKEVSTDTYQQLMVEACSRPDLVDALSDAMERVDRAGQAEWLVRRYVGSCRYTIQVYKLMPEASQAPHQHHNLISTHLVLRGKIHLREYQRIATDEADNLVLEPARDDVLTEGEMFQASEWCNNVHWFGAVDGPALMFSIDARGYETSTFHQEKPEEPGDAAGFGRRYLDPTSYNETGYSIGVNLPEDVAKHRFEDRPLSDFPAPAHASAAQLRYRKSA
ncbi:MAG: hypothetical protein AAGB04_07635 [Pseudomonadota bacterium]